MQNTALSYLTKSLQLTADVDARRRLSSTNSTTLVVTMMLGDRAFLVSAAWTSNALLSAVRAAL